MYYIILDYDNGAHFDVLKRNDIDAVNKTVQFITQQFTSTWYNRKTVSLEVIESKDESYLIKKFERNNEVEGINKPFKEIFI